MNYPSAMTQVRQANPVPDPTDLPAAAWSDAELLHVIDERTARMRELMNDPELEKAKQPRHRWRMPVVAAVGAFVVVLAAIGVAAFVGGEPDDEVTATTATTLATPTTAAPATTLLESTPTGPSLAGTEPTGAQLQLVANYREVRNGDSWEQYLALFAPGTPLERSNEVTDSWVNSLELEAKIFRFLAATGFKSELLRCQHYSPRLVCTFLNETAGTNAFNLDPWRMVSTFTFDDAGLITSFIADMSQYPSAAWEEFDAWLNEVHPDLAPTVMAASGREFPYDTDPDLALQLLDEYAVYLAGE